MTSERDGENELKDKRKKNVLESLILVTVAALFCTHTKPGAKLSEKLPQTRHAPSVGLSQTLSSTYFFPTSFPSVALKILPTSLACVCTLQLTYDCPRRKLQQQLYEELVASLLREINENDAVICKEIPEGGEDLPSGTIFFFSEILFNFALHIA